MIEFWQIGKPEKELDSAVQEYIKRIKSFVKFETVHLSPYKGDKSIEIIKLKEGQFVLDRLKPTDTLILLDERGKSMNSIQFAEYIEKKFTGSSKRIVFLCGGAYGFSGEIYQRAVDQIGLSSMTFSHKLIQLLFTEQLYRAFTIINKHPYHNE